MQIAMLDITCRLYQELRINAVDITCKNTSAPRWINKKHTQLNMLTRLFTQLILLKNALLNRSSCSL